MRIGINALCLRNSKGIGVEKFVHGVVAKMKFGPSNRVTLALRQCDSQTRKSWAQFIRQNRGYISVHTIWPERARVIYEQIILAIAFYRQDVIFSVNNFGPLFGKPGQLRIIALHDVWFLSDRYNAGRLKRLLFKTFLKLQLVGTHHIVTISEFSKREIVSHLGVVESDITVINIGVDWEITKAVNRDATPLQLPFSSFFLLIGSSRENKNVWRAIEAFELASEALGGDIGLVICGVYSEEFVQRVRSKFKIDHGNIQFSGYVSDAELIMMYRRCRAVVFPSLYEGFGIPVLEALLLEKPVLVSSGTTCEEIAGPAGIVVDGYSVASIAEGYKKLKTFKFASIAAIIRETVRPKYNNLASAKTIVHLIQNLSAAT